MLTPQDVRHFQERLESEREAIKARIAARSRDIQETVREESGVGDSADEAVRLDDREVEAEADDLDRVTLAEINRALRRIDEGTYGLSEVSGKAIPMERLQAVPYASTLVDEPTPELE
jgi:RNA polymerase-binding protein DksA